MYLFPKPYSTLHLTWIAAAAMLYSAACGDNAPALLLETQLTLAVPEDGALLVDPGAVAPNGAPITFTFSPPAHGSVTGTGPTLNYKPAADYAGPDRFEITVATDAESIVVPVSITVTPINDAPLSNNLDKTTNENQGVAVALNSTDIDNTSLTYTVVDMPAYGTLTGVIPNLTYTPNTAYFGPDSFTYKASDGILDSNIATVTLTIANIISCGDGIIEGAEQCDDGNAANTDACLPNCMTATCGDGAVRAGVEQCDDSNADNNDACLNTCVTAACGDGIVRSGTEQCDDGNQDNNDACLNTCNDATCGDGVLRTGVELCDDGNADNTDACTNACSVASCGDGIVLAGVEQCDDGNAVDTDTCLSSCTSAGCGDGFIQAGVEACDDTNSVDTDACTNSCADAACGDGLVFAGVEQCDDGNSNDADACRNNCTAPVCGDGALDFGEECDDSNILDDDGCGHSCKIERCGDGLVQFPRSEQCDDGNTVANDGCDPACQTEPFTTTAPVKISGTLSCTTAVANAARKVAVDGSGVLYGAMQCGTSAYVVTSTNRGVSFSAPFELSADLPNAPVVVSQVAISTGPNGVAYAAIMLNTGAVYLRTTVNRGATWSAGALIGAANSTSSGLSLASFNDDVYVGFSTGGGVAVARNRNRGIGAFDITAVGMSIAFFDVLFDIVQGTVVVAADTPGFHIRASNDGGVTFASEVNPPGQQYYSDWALANGKIFAVGINLGASGEAGRIYIIPTSNLTTSTSVSGLPIVSTAQTRSVAADDVGNAFVASQLNGGGVQLDRLVSNATAFDVPRILSATGTSPIVAPLPGHQGAAVIFTVGAEVFATIQQY